MRSIHLKLFIFLLVTGMLLSACNLSASQLPPDQLSTLTAATVSARLTQMSIETLVAQATQQALVSSTPLPTETLALNFTPTITLTPTATATSTATPVPPTATPIPIPCNLATFITDVTVKDGVSMIAGQSFVKTWRVKNSGSCNWTTGYSVYFVNGNAMSAPASVPFPKTVKPGETVDLSVSMVAPGNTGDFSGNWMISAPSGSVFGVGSGGGVPITVKIKVASIPAPHDANTIYDFVANYCSGQWRTNAGYINCPTSGYDFKNGTITRSYAPVLENGVVDDEGALITIPSTGGDGFIQGQFPKLLIHSGDHFVATLLCSANMPSCSVKFELLYKVNGSDTVTSLGSWDKVYDNTAIAANVDLSALDGQEIIFFLKVSSKGDSTNDFAQWMAARVTHP